MNKKLLIVIISLVVVGLVGLGLWKSRAPKQTDTHMEEIKPEVGTIKVSISTTGTVEPQNRLEIQPPIGGRVEKIMVKEGESVHMGQILALMSSTERAALLDAARIKDPSEMAYWEEAYKATPVIAPINGKIIVRDVEPGQTVTSSDVLFVLSNRLMVKANVDETDIGNVAVGQTAEIQLDAYPEVKVSGKVDHISYESTVVNNVTTYLVEIVPDSVPDVFRSGMSANIEIVEKHKDNVLILPTTAIRQREGRAMVLVKSDGDRPFRPQKVQLGIADLTHTEIVQGLSADDTVVVVSEQEKTVKNNNGSKEKKSPFMPSRPNRRGGR